MTYLTDARIFLCLTPTKMSYSFDSLMSQAEKIFAQNPLSGHLFLFLNRDRDRIKILFWDQDGFCIWYKRLEAGVFKLPCVEAGTRSVELRASELAMVLDGIDVSRLKRVARYERPIKDVEKRVTE